MDKFKELIQNLKDFSNNQQCTVQKMRNFIMYLSFYFLCFYFHFSFFFNLKISWNVVSSRNIFLGLRNKPKVFYAGHHYELKKSSYTVLEALSFPKIDKLDSKSNFSEIKRVIHNGIRRITLIYQSDKQNVS